MPWDWLLPSLVFLLPLVLLLSFLLRPRPSSVRSAAVVLTQSPANHSPRALAHATALLASRAVDVVILVAELPLPSHNPPSLHFIPLQYTPLPAFASARTPLALLRKLLRNARALYTALRAASDYPVRVEHVILNLPPALPTLPLALLFRPLLFRHAVVTLDWHNLAFSIMQSTGSPPALIEIARFAELFCARFAHNHWAVSATLADYIAEHVAVQPAIVYDRPRKEFRDALRERAANSVAVLARAKEMSTRIGTELEQLGLERAPLVVTSTSWTPDEDFTVLLSAMRLLERRGRSVVVVITGKGPLRAAFETSVRAEGFKIVCVWFAWLPIEDYPRLLAAANAGISLHASSSGLDLPMKAVDMLGCGLPVLALRYKCIGELVVEGETGVLFDDASGLADAMERLLFERSGVQECNRMRANIQNAFGQQSMMWQSSWERDALPTLKKTGIAATVRTS